MTPPLATERGPWLVEKTSRVVIDLSRAIAHDMPTEVRACILEALYNACKLHLHAVELDTGAEIRGLLERLYQHIRQHPEETTDLLVSLHDRAKQQPNTPAAFHAQQNGH